MNLPAKRKYRAKSTVSGCIDDHELYLCPNCGEFPTIFTVGDKTGTGCCNIQTNPVKYDGYSYWTWNQVVEEILLTERVPPCPICDRMPRIYEWIRGRIKVTCKCHLGQQTPTSDSLEDAIDLWNIIVRDLWKHNPDLQPMKKPVFHENYEFIYEERPNYTGIYCPYCLHVIEQYDYNNPCGHSGRICKECKIGRCSVYEVPVSLEDHLEHCPSCNEFWPEWIRKAK